MTTSAKSSTSKRKKGPTAVARAYFDAISSRDLDAAVALWDPAGADHLVGMAELSIPHGFKAYFNSLFAAFPDFTMEVLTVAAQKEHAAVQWRATATFDGTGTFEGMKPNGATIDISGCDMLTIRDGLIVENFAYLNGADMARQLGAMPPQGSPAEKALVGAFNAKTAATDAVRRFRDR